MAELGGWTGSKGGNVSALDLRKKAFGDFMDWMKENGIDDPFNADVWASKVFDALYQEYRQSRQVGQVVAQFVNARTADELQKLADEKRLKVVEP